MITTEDRARAAMQAIGDTVRAAPPLELSRRPGGAARPGRAGYQRRLRRFTSAGWLDS